MFMLFLFVYCMYLLLTRGDNVFVDPETEDIYVAGHPHFISYVFHKFISLSTEVASWDFIGPYLLSIRDRFLPAASIIVRVDDRNTAGEDMYLGRSTRVSTLYVGDMLAKGQKRDQLKLGEGFWGSSAVATYPKKNLMLVAMLSGQGVGVCKLDQLERDIH